MGFIPSCFGFGEHFDEKFLKTLEKVKIMDESYHVMFLLKIDIL